MEQSLVGLPGHEASELVRETGGGAVIESSLALADCMTDRGSGPALSVRALALSEFDVDSLAGVLAKVIAAPPIVYEIDKHRPVWQPRGRQPQGKG